MLMKSVVGFAGVLLLVTACDPEKKNERVDTDGVRDRTLSTLQTILTASGAALQGTSESETVSSTGDALAAAGDSLGGDEPKKTDPARDDVDCAPGDDGCMPEEEIDFEDGAQDAYDELADLVTAVLNNGECSLEDGKVVCWVQGTAALCTDTEASYCDQNGCTDQEVVDQTCVDHLDELEIRIAFELVGDGVKIYVWISPSRFEPIVFELHPNSIEATADLGAILSSALWLEDTISAIETAEGTGCTEDDEFCEDDSLDLPPNFSLVGKLRAKVAKTGAKAISAEFGVVEAVALKFGDEGDVLAGEEDAVYLKLNVAASDPLLAIALDGTAGAESIDVTVDVGPVSLDAALGMFEDEDDYSDCVCIPEEECDCSGVPYDDTEEDGPDGLISIYLAGITGHVALAAGDDEIVVDGIGLGGSTSTVAYNDGTGAVSVLEVDINEDYGRVFDLTVTHDNANETATFTFDPAFVASIFINTTPFGGEDNPNLDETVTLSLTSSANDPPSLTPLPEIGIQVSGTLAISSTNPDAVGVTVENQCLVANEGAEEDGHPLNMLSAGACE